MSDQHGFVVGVSSGGPPVERSVNTFLAIALQAFLTVVFVRMEQVFVADMFCCPSALVEFSMKRLY